MSDPEPIELERLPRDEALRRVQYLVARHDPGVRAGLVHPDVEVRAAAALGLREYSAEGAVALVADLGPYLRQNFRCLDGFLAALAWARTTRLEPLLVQAFDDPDGRVRLVALSRARSLGRETPAVELPLPAETEARVELAWMLRERPALRPLWETSRRVFFQLLADAEPAVPSEAVQATQSLWAPLWDQALALAGSDPSPAVRTAAFRTLARGDGLCPDAVIERGLADPDEGVRRAAAEWVAERTPGAGPTLAAHASLAVRHAWFRVAPPTPELLRDPEYLGLALERLHDAGDPDDQERAAVALLASADDTPLPWLLEHPRPEVRWAVAAFLARSVRVNHFDWHHRLVAALREDPEPGVRAVAIEVPCRDSPETEEPDEDAGLDYQALPVEDEQREEAARWAATPTILDPVFLATPNALLLAHYRVLREFVPLSPDLVAVRPLVRWASRADNSHADLARRLVLVYLGHPVPESFGALSAAIVEEDPEGHFQRGLPQAWRFRLRQPRPLQEAAFAHRGIDAIRRRCVELLASADPMRRLAAVDFLAEVLGRRHDPDLRWAMLYGDEEARRAALRPFC